MNKIYTIIFIGLINILAFENADARPYRVSQIPNGHINQCLNCHVTPGGPRNPFGQEIENNHLSGGDVVWSEELAALDSDGDGYSNGLELQDPDGTWRIGDLNPGDEGLVSQPGNENSIPPQQSVNEIFNYISEINVYPNPAIDNTNVRVNMKEPAELRIAVYNLVGEPVMELLRSSMLSGENIFEWDLFDVNGNRVPQGRYFIQVTVNGVNRTVKTVDVLR